MNLDESMDVQITLPTLQGKQRYGDDHELSLGKRPCLWKKHNLLTDIVNAEDVIDASITFCVSNISGSV